MTDNLKAKKVLTDTLLKVRYFFHTESNLLLLQTDPQYIPSKDEYITIGDNNYIVEYKLYEPKTETMHIKLLTLEEYTDQLRKKY